MLEALALVLLAGLPATAQQKEIDRGSGGSSRHVIAPGKVQGFAVDLRSGELVRFAVEQQGIDVTLRLSAPGDEIVWEVDSPNGSHGPEELVAIAPVAGRYRLEVEASPDASAPGTYAMNPPEHRPATEADRELVAADHRYHEVRRWVRDNPRQAVSGLEPLLEVWRDLGDVRREAETLKTLCAAYPKLKRPDAAERACTQAIDLYRALGDERRLALMLQNTGAIYLRQGDPEWALKLLEESRSLFENHGDKHRLLNTLARLVTAYRQMGLVEQALAAIDLAREESRGIERSQSDALRLTEIADALRDFRRAKEAIGYYEKALIIYMSFGNERAAALCRLRIAETALDLGDIGRAEKSMDGFFDTDDPYYAATAYSTIGRLLYVKSKFHGARKALTKGLELARQGNDRRTEAWLLVRLAQLETSMGIMDRGLKRYDRSHELFQKIGNPHGQAISAARGAEVLRDQGRLHEAWQRVLPALDQVEALRAATNRRDLRLSFYGHRQDYYRIAIDILRRLHHQRPEARWDRIALDVNERRLRRELLDRLQAVPGRSADVDQALLRRQSELQKQLRDLIAAPTNPARAGQISASMVELESVHGKMRAASKEVSRAPVSEELAVSGVVKTLLDDDMLLLVYALDRDRSLLWAVTAPRIELHELAGRAEIEGAAAAFVKEITRVWSPIAFDRSQFGRKLSRMLLEPVSDVLDRYKRLVLVLDGGLQGVPFAALPPPGFFEAGDSRFLVEDHEIVVLPSLSTLIAQRRRSSTRAPSNDRLAILADPVFSSEDLRLSQGGQVARSAGSLPPRLERIGRLRGFDPWIRLEGSGTEAERIRDVWGVGRTSIATGFEATRQAFLELEDEGYGILHFATHAFLTPEIELSGLVFSLFDQGGHPLDGYLPTVEISQLDLSAELVVLSACETGLGWTFQGEGSLGLAWSFFHAGARRVISSMWKVQDEPTARLMAAFYRHLTRGLEPAAALRRAQVEEIERPDSHTHQWAAFVFQGDWQSPMVWRTQK